MVYIGVIYAVILLLMKVVHIYVTSNEKERDCSCCDRCVDDDQCVENESDGERIYLSASDNVEICEVTRKCETLNIATQLPLKK